MSRLAAEERRLVAAFQRLRDEYGPFFEVDDAIAAMAEQAEARIDHELRMLDEQLRRLERQEARRGAGGLGPAVLRALERLGGTATSAALRDELAGLWNTDAINDHCRRRRDLYERLPAPHGQPAVWRLRPDVGEVAR